MKRSKKDRQQLLLAMIEMNPFVTDEQLALEFNVSVQTIRLDRMELAIPELRERIKGVATQNYSNKLYNRAKHKPTQALLVPCIACNTY